MLTLKLTLKNVRHVCLVALMLIPSSPAWSQPRTFNLAYVIMTRPGEVTVPEDVRLTRWLPMPSLALPERAPMPQVLERAQHALLSHGLTTLSQGSYLITFQGGPRNLPLLDTHGQTLGNVRVTLDRFFDTSWRMLPTVALPNGLEHQRRTRTGVLNLLDQPRCAVLFGFWPLTKSTAASSP